MLTKERKKKETTEKKQVAQTKDTKGLAPSSPF